MTGTIVNTAAIVVGTLVGTMLNRGIKEKYKIGLYDALGLASLAIGLNATLQYLPRSHYPVLFIVALAVGTIVGTRLDIDGRFKRLVSKHDAADASQHPRAFTPSKNLADGLSTATLLYCIGPLSMLGPVISALKGDNTFLYTNATLDLVSSTIFASTYGFWMILAAPVLFLWQGFFYMVARLSSRAVSDDLMAELLIVGGLMIMGSGLNLLKLKEVKTLNMLPALLVPVAWFIVKTLFNS